MAIARRSKHKGLSQYKEKKKQTLTKKNAYLAMGKNAYLIRQIGTCGLSVTTFFHQVLNYYYLTVYIMFNPKMSLEGSVH